MFRGTMTDISLHVVGYQMIYLQKKDANVLFRNKKNLVPKYDVEQSNELVYRTHTHTSRQWKIYTDLRCSTWKF